MSAIYYERTTTGYRLPPVRPHTTVGVSRPNQDDSPPEDRVPPAAEYQRRRRVTATGIRPATLVPGVTDAVTADGIWTQTIQNSRRRAKLWETQWGFTIDIDPKGHPKERRELPESVSVYSPDFPNTDSSRYGWRLNTDAGQRIQNLEARFYSANRRRKFGSDLTYY